MKRTSEAEIQYFSEIDPLVRSLGCRIVEFSVSKHRGSVQARLVIAGDRGVGVEQCSKAHKLAQPRLEMLLGAQDLSFEVASPGISRIIKDAREFALFEGKGAKLLLEGSSEWVAGTIGAADEEALDFRSGGKTMRIPYGLVAKAKLDYAQEEG